MKRSMTRHVITHKSSIFDYIRVGAMVLVIFVAFVAVKLIGLVFRNAA
jgi:hypothetical protein